MGSGGSANSMSDVGAGMGSLAPCTGEGGPGAEPSSMDCRAATGWMIPHPTLSSRSHVPAREAVACNRGAHSSAVSCGYRAAISAAAPETYALAQLDDGALSPSLKTQSPPYRKALGTCCPGAATSTSGVSKDATGCHTPSRSTADTPSTPS